MRFPLLTTFNSAITSRNVMPSPTSTMRAVPVVCCCSPFTRDMFGPPQAGSASGNSFGVLAGSGLTDGFQFHFDCGHQIVETLLEGIAIAVGGAADPQRVLSGFCVANRHGPEP